MAASALHFEEIAEKIEAMKAADPDLIHRIAATVGPLLPSSSGPIKAEELSSTDYVLHLIDTVIPGWSIRLKGKALEPDGHWSCTLRLSEARDEDEFIGFAKGPHLSSTLIAALLRVLAYRARRAK